MGLRFFGNNLARSDIKEIQPEAIAKIHLTGSIIELDVSRYLNSRLRPVLTCCRVADMSPRVGLIPTTVAALDA